MYNCGTIIRTRNNNFTSYSIKKIATELAVDGNYISYQTVNNRIKAIEPFFNILKEQNQELINNLLNITRGILINNILTKEQKINIICESQFFKETCERIKIIKQQNIQNNNIIQQQNEQLIENYTNQQLIVLPPIEQILYTDPKPYLLPLQLEQQPLSEKLNQANKEFNINFLSINNLCNNRA